MVSNFLRTSGVAVLVSAGLGLLTWGVSAQFGLPSGAMLAGSMLLWAGAQAAKELR
jgi:hypothetical protein